ERIDQRAMVLVRPGIGWVQQVARRAQATSRQDLARNRLRIRVAVGRVQQREMNCLHRVWRPFTASQNALAYKLGDARQSIGARARVEEVLVAVSTRSIVEKLGVGEELQVVDDRHLWNQWIEEEWRGKRREVQIRQCGAGDALASLSLEKSPRTVFD